MLRNSKNEEKSFEDDRDNLEASYQVNLKFNLKGLVEIKIRKEREHLKEFLKKKPKDPRDRSKELKNEEDEMIRDRTPILDQLIDKYNYFNSEKRKILERYQKNTLILKDSFDILMDLLGLNDYSEIPIVLEKMESQHAEIEMYCSKLGDEIIRLESEKEKLENSISNFRVNSCLF